MEFSRILGVRTVIRPALDLVSADVASQPDVSQPFVNGFGCGKVHNLGGRVTN